MDDSVESELLKNLENLFGFQYKGKKFQDLSNKDFLDVYKIFFRIYDTAWLLSDSGKPKSVILKQITSFLQRMELGHLILKGEDLLDSKKNCRLLGAIVSKLESRHNRAHIQAAVRKIRLLKAKTTTEKNLQKITSSASSGDEEAVKLELVVPIKGKELPRTPPSRPGSDAGAIRTEFLKTSPLAAHLNQLSKPTQIVSTNKGFRPILPTKEIPRTPLNKGTVTSTTVDTCYTGHNLTADFSSARLTSSNTSTPYDHRTSRNKTSAVEGDATFVVCTKQGIMETSANVDKEISEHEEDGFEDGNGMTGTYVKTKPKETPEANDNTWVLETENNSETVPPTETLPVLHGTFALPKKNGGRTAKMNKVKNSAAAQNDEETTTVKKAAEVTAEDAESKDFIDNDAAKGKKGRGKKAVAKKDSVEEKKVDAVVVSEVVEPEIPVTEVESEKPVESKGKKGRGKKAVAKKDSIEENNVDAVVTAEVVEPEIPVAEVESEKPVESKGKKGRGKKAAEKIDPVEEIVLSAEPVAEVEKETKKGRNKKPSKKEINEEKQDEVLERISDDVDAPTSVVEQKEKKGRGKKAELVAKAEEINSLPKDDSDPEVETTDAQPEAVKVVAGPKPKMGPKSKVGLKSKIETEPAEKEEETSPVVEPKVVEKKGRGKKANQLTDSAPVTETDPLEAQVPQISESSEAVTVPEGKKGRGKAKTTIEVKEQKESESPATVEKDVKEKRGRGKPTAPKVVAETVVTSNEESSPDDEIESPPAPVETKEKKTRGRPAKQQAPVKESTEDLETIPAKKGQTESPPVVETKEKKGRQVKAQVAVEETPEVLEAVPAKKGRGKKAAAPAATKVQSDEEVVEEVTAKGKKDVPEAAEKKQKTTKRGKAAIAEDTDVSPSKKSKEGSLESEVVRKSSRNQGEPIKTYDESSDDGDKAAKKRGGRKKAATVMDAVAEDGNDNKKKPAKKKASSESPESQTEPPKVAKAAAAKRGTKRVQNDDAPAASEPKKRGAKKDEKSPELPLKVVNGLEEDAGISPPKRSRASEDDEAAAEEPEKKTGRSRKKKEVPQPAETENKSPDDGIKKSKKNGIQEIAVAVEVEKKKPVGRKKKAAAVHVEEPEGETSPASTKQRGKRAGVQDTDAFVTVISGQQSTDPSPVVSEKNPKGRRLKLAEEKQPVTAQTESDEEVAVPVTKRTYARRNK